MCGRTACTLCKSDFLEAARMYSCHSDIPWIEIYPWQSYKPSYNVNPRMVTPVLLAEKTLKAVHGEESNSEKLCVFPMKWGLIPSWYNGSEKDFNLSTHNCRCETVLEKPSFIHALKSGQRCIILVDGFFEWKSVGREKKPYFIYLDNENGMDMETRTWKNEYFICSDGTWIGPRLLPMAGIFDVWLPPEPGLVYSYSIFTMGASKTIASIHDRMPVILDDPTKVHAWLNAKNGSLQETLKNFKAVEKLKMYEVDSVVNNAKCDEIGCVMPLAKRQASAVQPKITSWFTRGEQ